MAERLLVERVAISQLREGDRLFDRDRTWEVEKLGPLEPINMYLPAKLRDEETGAKERREWFFDTQHVWRVVVPEADSIDAAEEVAEGDERQASVEFWAQFKDLSEVRAALTAERERREELERVLAHARKKEGRR